MAIAHMEVPMKIHQPAAAMEDAPQGARRATGEASSIAPPPNPEVAATAKRRQFSPSERRRILAAADRCSKNGEIGALLRREGIYSSLLATWRKQREATERAGLEPKKRGRKADPAIAEARRVAELTRENGRLRRRLAQAHTIIDVQKNSAPYSGYPRPRSRRRNELSRQAAQHVLDRQLGLPNHRQQRRWAVPIRKAS